MANARFDQMVDVLHAGPHQALNHVVLRSDQLADGKRVTGVFDKATGRLLFEVSENDLQSEQSMVALVSARLMGVMCATCGAALLAGESAACSLCENKMIVELMGCL